MSLKQLEKICQTLLSKSTELEHKHQALEAFARLCSEHSQIIPSPSTDAWAGDTYLAQGLAICPEAAAQCTLDYQRSLVFIQAVYSALQDLLQTPHAKPVQVLYAGCGPYATLILPLISHFDKDEIDYYLLDIHPSSLSSVENLLSVFGLDQHSVHLLNENACEYQHPEALDLILSETMQHSLEHEPQFQVTANLAPQLAKQGIFIPQCIEVSLHLSKAPESETLDSSQASEMKMSKLAELMRLTATSASHYRLAAEKFRDDSALSFQTCSFQLPNHELTSGQLVMETEIRVYQSHVLKSGESDITRPRLCFEIKPLKPAGKYQVRYSLGAYPKFEFSPY